MIKNILVVNKTKKVNENCRDEMNRENDLVDKII